MRISVLGTGLVGSAMARDLDRDPQFQVTAVDASAGALARLEGIDTRQADLSTDEGVHAAVRGSGLVVLAVPGFMGFETLRRVIETGTDVVDISFFPEDPFLLDGLAKEHDVTAVVDCGIAPGLCNMLAGHLDARLQRMDRYLCYVGGLPRKPVWPYNYRSVFSPIDVIEEYTRPARYVENGQPVTREALSDVEIIETSSGRFEAFNTDGLRTLMRTLDAPDMKEKTLRWPGHAELMRIFRETGLFSADPIPTAGGAVSPIDVTSKLLFEQWRMPDDEEDMTLFRVLVEGQGDAGPERHTFDLLDVRTDETSMARTTGYTATMAVRLVAAGKYRHEGISPPEFVGRTEGCLDIVLDGLRERGVDLQHQVENL